MSLSSCRRQCKSAERPIQLQLFANKSTFFSFSFLPFTVLPPRLSPFLQLFSFLLLPFFPFPLLSACLLKLIIFWRSGRVDWCKRQSEFTFNYITICVWMLSLCLCVCKCVSVRLCVRSLSLCLCMLSVSVSWLLALFLGHFCTNFLKSVWKQLSSLK